MTDYSASIAALEEALASGEKTIKVEGKETTYRDVSEILAALREFRRLQATAAAPLGRPAYSSTLATFGGD